MLGLLLAATVLASEPPPPTPVLEVNGAATKLDALGPVVVGKDGSLGLISGWAELSPQEKEAGLAQVTRRNAKRLAQLKQEEAAREEAERRRGPVARLARRALQWGIGVARRFRRIRRPAKLASAPASTPTSTSTSTSTSAATSAATFAATSAAGPTSLVAEAGDGAIVTMDFAPEYVASILDGGKRATTRWLSVTLALTRTPNPNPNPNPDTTPNP